MGAGQEKVPEGGRAGRGKSRHQGLETGERGALGEPENASEGVRGTRFSPPRLRSFTKGRCEQLVMPRI